MKRTTRRKFLSVSSAAVATSLAGCFTDNELETPETSTESDDEPLEALPTESEDPVLAGVNYPDGFDENGVTNFQKALGTESAYYQSKSLTIDTYIQDNTTDTSARRESRVSAETKRRLTKVLEDERLMERQFQEGDILYTTSVVGQVESQRIEYDKQELYCIPKLKEYLSKSNLSVHSITDSDELVYTGSIDIDPTNSFDIDMSKTVFDKQITLTITQNGLPVRIELTFYDGGGNVLLAEHIEFSLYNISSVDRPSWVYIQ